MVDTITLTREEAMRKLLQDMAVWLDPMHLSAPSYADCCIVHGDIMNLLNSKLKE